MNRSSNLIDDLLPRYDECERHTVTIDAPPDAVYRALRETDFGRLRALRALLALRAVPALLTGRLAKSERREPLTLDNVVYGRATLLAEDPGQEIVLGIVGPFWRLCPELERLEAAEFRRGPRPGTAFAAWNFALERTDDGRTSLATETRVLCGDDASRKRFRRYWLLVHPFSAFIRRVMLRAIKREAERRRR